MLQLYSDGIAVAAGAAVPLNNITYAKGSSATHLAPATISLNQRGVYLVQCDITGFFFVNIFNVDIYYINFFVAQLF